MYAIGEVNVTLKECCQLVFARHRLREDEATTERKDIERLEGLALLQYCLLYGQTTLCRMYREIMSTKD